MQQINNFFLLIDRYLASSDWFALFLLGTGLFFTFYLVFPQIRYFKHAIRVVRGKYDRKSDKGDTSHFQALSTALSGTVGTGNIAGVALAIHIGGPGALFWMLITAMLGMTTKFVEVTLSHKYRKMTEDGTVAGGPMYYMKERLNIRLKNGKLLRTGLILGGFFAFATIFSSFGTGNMPQINSISNSLFTTFGVNHIITGAVLAVLLGLVIIGGIKRIASVTSRLVPAMAFIYFFGALSVLIYNYDRILPALAEIFTNVFTGSAAAGGFLGAGFIYAFKRGVARGLFSNEAGQGSAPIAHAAARAHEPVSEGLVAILEPFIDTVIICMLTGLTIISSGVWKEKIQNRFQFTDLEILSGTYNDSQASDREAIFRHIHSSEKLPVFDGSINVKNGNIGGNITVLHSESVASAIKVYDNNGKLFEGTILVKNGRIEESKNFYIEGKSLIHSAPLTAEAFKRGLLGDLGQYIVSIGLLLFAFSTAISWSYYGDRAVTFLWGSRYVMIYRIVYVIGFFIASFIDTTIIWSFSYITVALMTIPNLFGLLILSREVKSTVRDYWKLFRNEYPGERSPRY
jgi:AGCS family alanine or glycine:cation symporter